MNEKKMCITIACVVGIFIIAAIGISFINAHTGDDTSISNQLDKATDLQGKVYIGAATYTLNTWQANYYYSYTTYYKYTAHCENNLVVIRAYQASSSTAPDIDTDGTLVKVYYYPIIDVSCISYNSNGVTYTWYA